MTSSQKTKTEYLHIHDQAYERLRREGRESWSDPSSLEERAAFYGDTLQRQEIAEGSVLILGCGDGETSIALARKGYRVTGMDISPTAIQWAAEKALQRGAECSFITADLVSTNFRTDRFDAIVDDHCLHCIIGDDRPVVFDRIHSLLNERGVFIMRTQCGDPPSDSPPEILKTWDPVTRCQIYDGVAGRYFGQPDTILAELRRSRLAIIQSRTFKASGWDMLEVIARV